jgi:hypothetical protein|tara:strand:- start:275 stop:382 length:108 start_codon:yes stop_codon:yes gene_type:complete
MYVNDFSKNNKQNAKKYEDLKKKAGGPIDKISFFN